MKYFFCLVAVFLCLLSCVGASKNKSIPKLMKGNLDLRDWGFRSELDSRKESIRKLDGEWEFFWLKLLTSEDFSCKDSKGICNKAGFNPEIIDYMQVPHSWNGHIIKNSSAIIGGDGFATYRLTVQIPDFMVGETLALRCEYQGTAYRIYMNSKLTQSAGVVEKNEMEGKALHLPTVGFIQLQSNRLEIIVQVSNYHNRLGGLWNHLYLGRSEQILSLVNQRRGTDLFVIGIIFIIGAYHFLIWSIRRKEVSPLFFSLLCIIVLIRLVSTSEYLFVEAFPYFDYKFYCLLEYGSMYFCVPVAIQYFTLSIRTKINRYLVYLTYLIATGFFLFAILNPVKIFSKSAELYQFILLLSILYLIYILVYSVIRKIEYSYLSLFGFLVLAVTLVQDILYSREMIHTGFYSPYALVIMIFTQAMTLSLQFRKHLKE